ncbi:MAG: hypothetical protein QM658_14120 [Gordonia sp. (in: high G+C Gram-positive bacteria)]
MNQVERWLDTISSGKSRRQIAADLGIPQTTFNRQVSAGQLDADTVILIARAYGAHPVAELAKSGHLTVDEASTVNAADLAGLLTDQQIVRELARRVDDRPAAWAGTFDHVVEESNVVTPTFGRQQPDTEERWAARDLGKPSEKELFDAAQDAAAEAPDPDGPEHGA